MRRILFALPVALALAAAVLLTQCSRRVDRRVLFIGVDGATFDVMTPMMERGELPNLTALANRGVSSPLDTFQPSLSPIIWTTIATGKSMEKHGIKNFVHEKKPDGTQDPVLSNERKVRAIWDILNENGIEVGIVGWWLTWPAERVDGFMVSSLSVLGAGKLWKGSVWKGVPGEVYPTAYGKDLDRLIDREQERATETSRDLFSDLDPKYGNESQRKVVVDTKSALLSDQIFFEAAREFVPRKNPPFVAVYWGTVDVASHRFWKYFQPTLFPERVKPEDVAALKDVIPRAYRWVDTRVGELVAAAGPDTTVIVASDHGFHAEMKAGMSDDERSGGHERPDIDLPGILIVAGPGIRHADWRTSPPPRRPSVFDLTPTLLYLYGLPVARDMDGAPCMDLFDPQFVASHEPEVPIETYEVTPRRIVDAIESDSLDRARKEAVERIKSLGYLDGKPSPPPEEPH